MADLSTCTHAHLLMQDARLAERRTRLVIAITAVMMVAEITAGMGFNSMALLADGWHMGTHVAAFMITALAYAISRRHAHDRSYAFGTGKVSVLGGFASAVTLALVALITAGESALHVLRPEPILFDDAIIVAVLGLLVNVICAWLLHDHGHDHAHAHPHGTLSPSTHGDAHPHPHHHDMNLRAAYVHVLADALTSVTAIAALMAGKWLGWVWLDPVMGMVGSLIIGLWAWALVRDSSRILLDRLPFDSQLPASIQRTLARDGARVIDLHVWQIAAGRYSALLTIAAAVPHPLTHYRALLHAHPELVHLTIEIQQDDEAASGFSVTPTPHTH